MSTLTLASQNIAAKSKAWQRNTFRARLDDILDGVQYYHPGVLALQETGDAPYLKLLDPVLAKANLLRAPHGGRWRHLYYDPRQVRLYKSGLMSLNRLHTKHAAWGKFVDLESLQPFFMTSVHLSAGGEAFAQARYAQAERLLRTSAKLNVAKYPEIHAGDFNSLGYVGRVVMEPRAFRDALDVATTSTRSGYNTFNDRTTVKPNPRTQQLDAEHLDHFYVDRRPDRAVPVAHWSQWPSVAAADHNLIAIKVDL